MPLPPDPRAAETLPVPDDDAPPWPSQALPGPSQALPGPSQAPRFEVRREVARGGLGRILEAHDRELDRPVALKELLRDSPGDRARLLREIRLTARLQHPAIVPLYDAVVDPDGVLRYAMKLVSGQTLEVAIERAADLEARLGLLRHLEAVADALAYAHSQGVIHRDVKPQNVLIGPFGETVLIDWGIARTLDEGPTAADASSPAPVAAPSPGPAPQPALTQVGSVVGTPAYMAPEQARGEPADRRADVYALGASLYHLLSGHPPWLADAATTLQALRDGRSPPPLPRISPGVPADLASIVARAMAPEPADRYPSALELSRDLQAFRTGQLVAARAYSSLDLLRRWLARHRALVAVSALAAVALALVGGMSARRVLAERDLAQAARAVAEARSHALILANARRGVAQDPTEAAAWLATYPDDGANPAERFDLAQELALRGVARVAVRHEPEGCDSLAWSADGQRLLPAGLRTGALDAATGAALGAVGPGRSELVLPRPDGGSIWLDAAGRVQHLAPDGSVRDLPALGSPPLAAAWEDPEHLLVGDRTGAVTRLPVDGSPSRPLLQLDGPVTALGQSDGRWFALGPAGALWSGPPAPDAGARPVYRHPVDLAQLLVAPGGDVLLGDVDGGVHAWSEAAGPGRCGRGDGRTRPRPPPRCPRPGRQPGSSAWPGPRGAGRWRCTWPTAACACGGRTRDRWPRGAPPSRPTRRPPSRPTGGRSRAAGWTARSGCGRCRARAPPSCTGTRAGSSTSSPCPTAASPPTATTAPCACGRRATPPARRCAPTPTGSTASPSPPTAGPC
ncbi:protein kinase [Myxococcota bacterium]|nr:protein kinase [Myxococcota bacterium]